MARFSHEILTGQTTVLAAFMGSQLFCNTMISLAIFDNSARLAWMLQLPYRGKYFDSCELEFTTCNKEVIMNIRKPDKFLRSLAATAIFVGGSSMALADVPEEKFTLARMAIEEAQEVDADTSSSGELTLAEHKLHEAEEAEDKGHDEVAERLLKQSMLHAELAEVEALQAQADLSYSEINAALASLEAEIRRP